MLQAYQILQLTKPYTDKQLVKQAETAKGKPKLAQGGGFWTNRFIALREPMPSKVEGYVGEDGEIKDAPSGFFAKIEQEVEQLNCPVVPIELRPLDRAYDKSIVIAKMQNCTCAGWVDAHYIAAVLKRNKKHVSVKKTRKGEAVIVEPETPLTWKAFNGGVVAQVDGEIVAVVMGLNLQPGDLDDEPEWMIRSVEDNST